MNEFNWNEHPVVAQDTTSFNWNDHPVVAKEPKAQVGQSADAFMPKINPSDWKTGNVEALGPQETPPLIPEATHPDVSFADRAIVQNFANSPQAIAGYMNKRGFETEIKDGRVLVRKPNEHNFLPIAPQQFDLQKISDNIAPLAQGIATGAATAGGGLIGNVPGAMAAGAGTNAGLEAIRQKLGQYLGIPQNVSGKDVAIAGATGGLTPALLGTGATAEQIAAKALSSNVPEDVVAQGQQSLLKRAFPKVAEATSGVPSKAIKTYIQNQPEVDAMIAEGPNAASNLAEQTAQQMKQDFFAKKADIGEQLANKINGSPNLIETNKIFQPLEDKLTQLKYSQRANTPSGQAEIEALSEQIDNMRKGLPENVSPSTAWEIQDQMKHFANYNNIKGTYANRYGSNATNVEKLISNAAGDSYKVINNELENAAQSAGLKKQYADASDLQDKLEKYFRDGPTTERTLSQLDRPNQGFARKTTQQVQDFTGNDDLRKKADILQSYYQFQEPKLMPKSEGGTTSTSRSLSLSSLFELPGEALRSESLKSIGRAGGNLAGGPAAVKAAIQFGNALPQFGALPARAAPLMLSPWLQMQQQTNEQDIPYYLKREVNQ